MIIEIGHYALVLALATALVRSLGCRWSARAPGDARPDGGGAIGGGRRLPADRRCLRRR